MKNRMVSLSKQFENIYNEIIDEVNRDYRHIKKLKDIVEKMKCNGNCKYGGGNRCTYPDAKYTNCYTNCNQWEPSETMHAPSRDIKLNAR